MTTEEIGSESKKKLKSGGAFSADGELDAAGFSCPELEQQFDLLSSLIDNSDRIALIKGGRGAGKTSLAQRIASQNAPEREFCSIIANPMLQPDQLMSLLGEAYAVESGDISPEWMLRRFGVLTNAGKQAVVVIDDAHLLPEASIIWLLGLFEACAADRVSLKIVLFATHEIDAQLNSSHIQTMNSQVIQTLELQPLGREQTIAFVSYLIQELGVPLEQMPVNVTKLERLYSETRGIPGAVKRRVIELVSEGRGTDSSEQSTSWLPDIHLPAILGGITIVVLIALTLVFEAQINAFLLGDEEMASPVKVLDATEQVVPLVLPQEQKELAEKPRLQLPGESLPVQDASMEEGVGPQQVADSKSLSKGDRIADVAASVATEPDIPEVAERVERAEAIISVPPVKELSALQEQEVPEVSANAVPVATVKPVEVVSQVKAEVVDVSSGTKALELRNESWLLKQLPTAYTLQLIGVGNRRAAENFIDQHHIRGEAAAFQALAKGRPWYAVVYGVYPDREAAVNARDKLPQALRQVNVWPRSLASVQDAIKKR